MKFTFSQFLLIFSLVIGTSLVAQNADQTIGQVQSALSAGSAAKLAAHFHTTIDLEIPGTEGSYQSKQAEIILNKFFEKHPPKSFKLNHKGSSDNGSKYIIGTYTSDKSYRVYVLLKLSGKQLAISNIQLEED